MGSETNPFRRAGFHSANKTQYAPDSAAHALTPLRAHYLKKTLVRLQLEKELAQMQQPDALEQLGPPFRTPNPVQRDKLPLIRHLLHQFVLTFPFFESAPPDFFPNKVQAFVERMLERNLIMIDPVRESKSASITDKTTAYLTMLVSGGLRAKDVEEEIVRASGVDRERLFTMDAHRMATRKSSSDKGTKIDIVSVRRTIRRGHIRNKTLDEFIVSTRAHQEEIHVARRYSDFHRLYKVLRAQFPAQEIPELPPKDMAAVEVNGALQQEDRDGEWVDMTAVTPNALLRERNRLTLRAFLRHILGIPVLADSEAFQDFLVHDPTILTSEDKADAHARRQADAVRETELKEFADQMAERARILQSHLDTFKSMLLKPDGLSQVFATIRSCPHVQDLPPEYKVIVDWATVSMASGLFTMFVARDSSSRAFAHLKYMHSMMPYFVVRGILRISNPVAMMRSFLDLFLAQPFGQKSLLQRMYTGKLHEELHEIKELTLNVRAKIPDPVYADKVDAFIALSHEMQCLFYEQAEAEGVDVLVVVLRSPLAAELQPRQLSRINRACTAYQKFKKQRAHARSLGLPDAEPESDDAWLLEDLRVYLSLCSAIHTKEQIISLIYDNATTELLKDMVTIFYAPLAQVYRVANVSDTLGDVQVFVNDLIKTVEENASLHASNPDAVVSAFVNLVQRHQQKFYHFVHQVHTKGSGLFQRLIHWIELFVNYVRDPREAKACGLGWIDLEQCLALSHVDRACVMKEVDAVIQHVYKLKLQRELKRRRKLVNKAVARAADEPQEEEAFINTMSEQFGFGSGLQDEIEELDGSDDETSDSDPLSSSDDDSGPEDADATALRRARMMQAEQPAGSSLVAPTTHAIKTMLPTFVQLILSSSK